MDSLDPMIDPPATNATNRSWSSFLEVATKATKSSGGAIWLVQQGHAPKLVEQFQLGQQPIDEIHHEWPGHIAALQEVSTSQTSTSLQAQFDLIGRSIPLRLVLTPVYVAQPETVVLELFIPEQAGEPNEQILKTVEQLKSLIAPTQSESASQFAEWLGRIHQHLSLQELSFAITNETRNWSQWDRVSLCVSRSGKLQLASISGVDTIDTRSLVAKSLEDLVNAFKQDNAEDVVVSSDSALAQYQKQSEAIDVSLFLLLNDESLSSNTIIGAIVFEKFGEPTHLQVSTAAIRTAIPNIAKALQHSLTFESARQNRIQKFFRSQSVSKPLAVFVLIFFTICSLCAIPAELTVSGRGLLQPSTIRDVFANVDGLIQDLHVSQGESIQQYDAVITLRDPNLEAAIDRLNGELKTVLQQISDLTKLRTDPRRSRELKQSTDELAARAEELKTRESSLQSQLNLLNLQSSELTLRSPISGEVITSDLKTTVSIGRPVQRTDRLLTIADLEGSWSLLLHVDYRDIGPVAQAVEEGDIAISFVTADNVETSVPAEFVSLAPTVTTDSTYGTTLVVQAQTERSQIPDATPQSQVRFRINCGRSSIGYVWFRRLIDRITTWWTLL